MYGVINFIRWTFTDANTSNLIFIILDKGHALFMNKNGQKETILDDEHNSSHINYMTLNRNVCFTDKSGSWHCKSVHERLQSDIEKHLPEQLQRTLDVHEVSTYQIRYHAEDTLQSSGEFCACHWDP
jgi:hypothetical protein